MIEHQIDIYIMTRDRELALRRTLQSLAKQRLRHLQQNVIIIDNNSNDLIVYELIKKEYSQYFQSIKIYKASKNIAALGYYFGFIQNNQKSKYTLKLDDDMILPENYIQALIDRLTENCVAISGKVNFFEDPDRCWSQGYYFSEVAGFSFPIKGEFKSVNDLPSCALLMRTSALIEAGGFSKDFFIYKDDTFLCYRLSKLGELKLSRDVVCLHDVPLNRRSSDFAIYNDAWSRCELRSKVSANKQLFMVITFVYFMFKMIFEILKFGLKNSLKNINIRWQAFEDHSRKRHRFFDFQLEDVVMSEI